MGIKNVQDAFIFLCADGSLTIEGSRTTLNFTPPRLSGEARGDSLQLAIFDSLQEEGAAADCSDADRDALKTRRICGVCLENLNVVNTL